jgi:hypothetical protein
LVPSVSLHPSGADGNPVKNVNQRV